MLEPFLGPFMKLPDGCFFCAPATDGQSECGGDDEGDDELGDPQEVSRRDVSDLAEYHFLEKRGVKDLEFCKKSMRIKSPTFDSSGQIVKAQTSIQSYGFKNPKDCNDYDFGTISTPAETAKYATEHILEFQLLKIFIDAKSDKDRLKYTKSDGVQVNLCGYLKSWWAGDTSVKLDTEAGTPMEILPKVFPGRGNNYASEFVVLEKYVNGIKEHVSVRRTRMPRYVLLTQ